MNKNAWLLRHYERIPTQNNEYDWGVLICKFADYLVRQVKKKFSELHVSNQTKNCGLGPIQNSLISKSCDFLAWMYLEEMLTESRVNQ